MYPIRSYIIYKKLYTVNIIYDNTSAVKFQISNIKSQIFFFRFGSNL